MARPGQGNPFSLPADVATFWLSEPEPEDVDAGADHRRPLKVWEKQTSASIHNKVQKIRDEDLPMAQVSPEVQHQLEVAKAQVLEEERPDSVFLTTIATKPAVGLVDPLKKNEKDVRTYIAKKRDIFLVNMACDLKKSEIVRIDEQVKARENALAKSQQMLDDDARKFEDFLQERIARAQRATKEAEESSKRKQDKVQKVKLIKQQIAGVQSEIGKLREAREEMSRYKSFLDKLTHVEWKEQQRHVKLNRKKARRQQWIDQRLAVFLSKIADEDERIREKNLMLEEARAQNRRPNRREQEEEALQKQREREARRKVVAKKREEEQKRVAAEYVEVSSEEEHQLFFQEPQQLMDYFTELEERNLFLIQSSQETEQALDEINHTFERTKKEMGGKVQQLKISTRQLEGSIAQEIRRGEQLKQSYTEKATTEIQDRKLAALTRKVDDLHKCCGLTLDHNPDVMSMLGSIESKIEELISSMDEAFIQDEELVMRLEWQKERERRDRARDERIKEQMDKQDERLKNSLLRSQAPVFKKAGKQVMYRSPPMRQEKKVVKDTTDDEAHARDHNVFSIYIDRKTNVPMVDAPVVEEPKGRTAAAKARTLVNLSSMEPSSLVTGAAGPQ